MKPSKSRTANQVARDAKLAAGKPTLSKYERKRMGLPAAPTGEPLDPAYAQRLKDMYS